MRSPQSSAKAGRFGDESGLAMISILGLTAVLTLFAVIVINTTLNAQRLSRGHEDWNAALAAAEAGVDDFLARLNRDRGYYENYVNDLDADGFNLNPAIDPDLWAALPNSEAYYHYRIDDSEVIETGTITLVSTGLVGNETRTVQVRVRPEAFFDFLYLTDFETMDPMVSRPANPPTCDRPWGASPAKQNACAILRFTTADVLSGPVHSNDAIVLDGNPSFQGEVTTAIGQAQGGGFFNYPTRSVVAPIPGDARFARSGDPRYTGRMEFPATNVGMANDAANVGCLYYGPTYIHLHGDTMTVRSPLSAQAPGAPATDAGRCAGGDLSNLAGHYGPIPIPPVIYVNHATGCGTFSNSNHPLGINRDEERVTQLRSECEYGDVFVWGELDSRLSIGARNNINIIWDLFYQDGEWQDGTNILGLIADNFVQLRYPHSGSANRPVAQNPPFPSTQPSGTTAVRPNSVSSGAQFNDPTVHAAIVSLERSFRVQNHDLIGNRGTFTLRGSLTQKFRGPVGVGGAGGSLAHGVARDYDYDGRLRFVSPPYFIDPVRAQFVVRTWAEVLDAVGHPDGLPDLP